MVRYWKINDDTVGFDDSDTETGGLVTSDDITGRWEMYQIWLAEGNEPEEWAPEVSE